MPRIPNRAAALALMVASLVAGLLPVAAARPLTRKGPYLALAPFTQAIHVDMSYLLTDYTTRTRTSEWLSFWSYEVGLAFSEEFALGLEHGATGQSYSGDSHEYDHTLIRARWFPGGGRWFVTGGAGFANAEAPLARSPGYGEGMLYDQGLLVTLGAGYEIPLGSNLAVKLQADWLQQRSYSHENQSGYRFDVDGWSGGVTLVWYP